VADGRRGATGDDVAGLRGRLAATYGDLSADVIKAVVNAIGDELANARIKSYVGVLREKRAKEVLTVVLVEIETTGAMTPARAAEITRASAPASHHRRTQR
jgi:ribosomal protein L12E/L44/L45/RPP1/RPP2